jgi:conjugal transfer/type IV secretion protein DotA/TraY
MAMSGNRTLKIAQYCLLPQILPRFAALFFSGFDYFAYFMAQVFRGVRLIPEGHAYLNPSEIGHYSIPDVIAAAGSRLQYRRENIDQVIIFYVILLGLVLMGMQALLLVIGMFAPQAMALSLTDYFGNAHLTIGNDPYQDLAFILLDRVFGVPGIFDSCVSTGQPCYMAAPDDTWAGASTIYTPPTFPWPFHLALQAMFAFYSTGLLIVAVMILLYFVVVIVAETAQTGTPFGRRFNKVWAPLRLVMALGLLIPISNGLNTAQYIVLYSAKLGSNFATNGWIRFNAKLSDGMMFSEEIVAIPKTPNIGDLLQFMMLAHACKAAEEGMILQEPKPNDWKPVPQADCAIPDNEQKNDSVINAYLVKYTANAAGDFKYLENTKYSAAKDWFNNGDMTVRIGDRGCSKRHNASKGHTIPTCGELLIPAAIQETNTAAGAYVIQEGYYNLVQYLWGSYLASANTTRVWSHWGFCVANIGGAFAPVQTYPTATYNDIMSGSGDTALRQRSLYYAQEMCPNLVVDPSMGNNIPRWTGITIYQPTADWLQGTYSNYMYGDGIAQYPADVVPNAAYSPVGASAGAIATNIIRKGVIAERARVAAGEYVMPIDLIDRGWGGAGLWYNRIARANGAITGSSLSVPKVVAFPELMMTVAGAKLMNNKNVSASDLFMPRTGEDSSLQFGKAGQDQAIIPMSKIYSDWRSIQNEYKPQTGNVVYDMVNMLFGTQGLFDLRDPGNQNVHPLALLTSMGKTLLEASIRNIAMGAGANIMGGALGADKGGAAASVMGTMLFTIVSITLGAGVILYYILPFMPFVYFFFAVGSWVKEVFEAMVGVPLWALAHIRIDGDGLPGSAAMNGYYMIFEIFLRPIMIVFGLIAAVSIFAAMAVTLNAVFDIAVINAGGANYQNSGTITFMEFARGPIDQLFYTVLYAVLMYIMAMSSFKMIDLIPNQIMRWMGAGVAAFASGSGIGDSAQGLMSNMTTYGTGSVSQAVGGIQKGSSAAGAAMKGMVDGK